MGNSLVVRRGTELAERMRALRAAQYVRMSTDLQQYYPPKSATHSPRWSFNRRSYVPPGWIVVIRLTKDHRAARDYLLFETGKVTQRSIRFSDQSWERYRWQRFETPEALVKAILRRARRSKRQESK